jgi:nucleoside-diphosphate-sugar epimerase
MSLLVVGASGFLGRNLLLSLPGDADVTAVYNHASTWLPTATRPSP